MAVPDWIIQTFPYAVIDPADPISPKDGEYNCIAYAAGDTTQWWDDTPWRYWPPGVPKDWSLAGLHTLFASLGYVPCGDKDQLEPGFEKVVFYTQDNGDFQHAAWQRADGRWKSKLGRGEDVIHDDPFCLSEEYGWPVACMKRPRQSDT